ncbi:GNAT family N-acetyltransferase [Vreelandella venusta]|uniref:GNAT family N-acetyltransferase n=1 Tax=Vreelandella venusta TaxID=44935 RepID=UPI00384AC07B
MRHAKDVTFHLLTPEDAVELLRFERAERAWFEQHIEARPECFYTPQGVAKHIIDCLALNAQRKMNPLIIRERGVIVGRANLRNIVDDQARVGYRIARSAGGRGIAQHALKRLLTEARCVYGVTQLAAVVAVDNMASQRVLTRGGFVAQQRLSRYSRVKGELKDCWVFEYSPAS